MLERPSVAFDQAPDRGVSGDHSLLEGAGAGDVYRRAGQIGVREPGGDLRLLPGEGSGVPQNARGAAHLARALLERMHPAQALHEQWKPEYRGCGEMREGRRRGGRLVYGECAQQMPVDGPGRLPLLAPNVEAGREPSELAASHARLDAFVAQAGDHELGPVEQRRSQLLENCGSGHA